MISRLRGVLLRRAIGVVEVMTEGGVAYEVQIPLTVFERLPKEGQAVELRTYQVVREDAVELFGFIDDAERAVFGRLLTASGVGPRLAVSILSTMSPERVVRAIVNRDIAALRQIPGLGTKKAERLALELADRLDDIAITAAAAGRTGAPGFEEAVHALVALGYSNADAASAVRKVIDEQGALPAIDLIKAALAAIKK
ncbi:MAG TPA: Holliday junction branch migration protein RuvA [Longimicrobiales bacterium]|nr:Holliday junction branch migration protein RuvA [Longimicrobiales bacterium]